MIAEHAAAVMALLDPDPVWSPYDGALPNPTPALPYWVVYFASAWPDLNFRGVTKTFQLRIYVHNVAGNGDAARKGSDRARALLLDVRPAVAGRTCYPIRWEESQPPQRDDTTGAVVMDAVDTYLLASVPG